MKIYGITVLVLASVSLIFGTLSKLFAHSSGDNMLIVAGVLGVIGGGLLLASKVIKLKAQ